ncbi:1-deoxy-D-xylulose-5-phosphate synthase [Acidithiobacillus sp. CV18-2]|uniref:1-deoxy-D-xylulose-5-phosphate synthase n=1 Tax=Igneacidithiobacillus copahuensis TaxID=2724909 RepID=A0AAE2YS63_9PROT|nr:1-deoxy-D-xylulose-5-phosphate synthase [Igneacidithiobacillus copahuensis]MBU2753829.1 1-deoxy-D-xylulose-5-phosphate synthase [Acidithiobacillus sp. CV18-3]MBU2756591.1 1-deoxy-D-xylulose-5-phosphate synthase [Acidithiobacillus sp. BN09-2]MBU2777457.1 1-deoxy-D-xylulose-5-phosphate synthase [Acidithiobacillus sp. CV18-2]MBU2796181.1 1-deoxy-D-xylulose-5-phosphate synthase [Acidithiobacillus sp. VAN18-2]MBU2799874.1 1-deoxy-D-xylulose-5-phosphate synthase [Acidithiobacillus sp. VAN18-4]UT
MNPLLQKIPGPDTLRGMSRSELKQVAKHLRQFLIETLSQTGGHLSSGLGTVELSVALHAVFHTPEDRLIWDVGHQAYPHKVLTGRGAQFPTLRQKDGLSGFLKREESPYDAFGAGHSSTSISAGLGMAVGSALDNTHRQVVAIIGDGAMTAGLAYEALNNGGVLDADLLVVLNDNEMSISPNVGAVSQYLTRLLSNPVYNTVREGAGQALSLLPPLRELAKKAEEGVKGLVSPGLLFEEMGFNYYGPIDGHDLDTLIPTLENLRKIRGPRLLHVITKKGKGYAPAEKDPCTYHGVTPFDRDSGAMRKSSTVSYTKIFGDWLCDKAGKESKLVAITPAMREGSGLVRYEQLYPERYFDVGIAEQHAVTFAGGLACEGFHPVVAIYSTFLQRAYDQLLHDVAIQNLPVLFAVDRAGLVGADGATHQGAFDLAYARCIPNLVIMAPKDAQEMREMLNTGYAYPGPAIVRYPRGAAAGGIGDADLQRQIPIGKAEILREGKRLAILAFGTRAEAALQAGRELDATVVNMRFVKPLDHALLDRLAVDHEAFLTVEEGVRMGGAGSAVAEYLLDQGQRPLLKILGLPDQFIEHGEASLWLAELGLDADGIRRAGEELLARLAGNGCGA